MSISPGLTHSGGPDRWLRDMAAANGWGDDWPTMLAHAAPGTAPALFTSGPHASAWFEHQLLAERGGLLLVTADDLDVTVTR